MTALRVEYDVREEDVLRLFEHWSKVSPTNRRLRIATNTVGSFATAWAIAHLLEYQNHAWLAAAGGAVLVLALFVLGGPIVNRAVWRRNLRNEHRRLLGTRRVSISPAGLHTVAEHGEGTLYWSGIDRIDEDADHIYLMAAGGGVVIPKRSFRSSDDADKVVERMRALMADVAVSNRLELTKAAVILPCGLRSSTRC